MVNYIPHNSIETEKYKDNSVTEEKVSFINVSPVKADSTTLVKGMRIDKQTGEPMKAKGSNYSNRIDIRSNKRISYRGAISIFAYDKDGEFLTYHNLAAGGVEASRQMSYSTAFIIFVVVDEFVDTFRMNLGEELIYEGSASDTQIDQDLIKIKENSIGERHLTDEYKNRLNENKYRELANFKPRKKLPKPMLVITYDDNPCTDFSLAFPVHEKYNVPGEACTVTDFLTGRMKKFPSFDYDSLSVDQLKQMQDSGWEISAHSASHITLGENSLSSGNPTDIGSNKWYVGNPYRWSHVGALRNPRKVLIGSYLKEGIEEEVTFIDSGEDEKGNIYLISKEPAKHHHTGGGSYVTLTEEELYNEIVESSLELNRLGFDSSSISYPYNANSKWSRRIVREHLESGRTGNFGKIDEYNDGLKSFINTQALKSYAEFTRWSEKEIDEMLDNTVENNGLAMIFEHSWTEGFNPERLDYAIKTAIEKGVEVTTRSKALEHHGNRAEIGDLTGKGSVYDNAADYFVINAMNVEFINSKPV